MFKSNINQGDKVFIKGEKKLYKNHYYTVKTVIKTSIYHPAIARLCNDEVMVVSKLKKVKPNLLTIIKNIIWK